MHLCQAHGMYRVQERGAGLSTGRFCGFSGHGDTGTRGHGDHGDGSCSPPARDLSLRATSASVVLSARLCSLWL